MTNHLTPARLRTDLSVCSSVRFNLVGNDGRDNQEWHNVRPGITVRFDSAPWSAPVEILSSSGGDAPGGAGVRELDLVGLDKNLEFISETVEMNGSTAVTTTKDFSHVNDIRIIEVGSTQGAEGFISLVQRDPAGSNVARNFGVILPYDAHLSGAFHQVPNGECWQLVGVDFYADLDLEVEVLRRNQKFANENNRHWGQRLWGGVLPANTLLQRSWPAMPGVNGAVGGMSALASDDLVVRAKRVEDVSTDFTIDATVSYMVHPGTGYDWSLFRTVEAP